MKQLSEMYLLKSTTENNFGDGYGGGSSGSGYGYGGGTGYGGGSGGTGYGGGSGSGNGYGGGSGSGTGYGSGIYYAKLWGDWFEISGQIENSLCVNLPEHHYNKIDKLFLQNVDNLESLRILREKIGIEKYLKLFDAKVTNTEIDLQGNQMKLYKYDEKGKNVMILEVICPSTGRLYHLYPPNQKAKTCMGAKASTFGKTLANFQPLCES